MKDNELTEDKLRKLLTIIPANVTDVYHAAANVFYVSFDRRLLVLDRNILTACNLVCDDGRSPLRNRYMITFAPSDDDESEAS